MRSVWKSGNWRSNAVVAGLYLALVQVLYAGTWQAGFVTDFTGFLARIDGQPASGILDCFGFPALHQMTNLVLYGFVKCFGVGGFGWHLAFTLLHTANAFLGYLLTLKIFEKSGFERPKVAALVAGLLFLASPYQAEVVIWRVCANFLLCTMLMLGSLWLFLRHFDEGNRRPLFWSYGLYFAALFTFELALALPLLVVAVLPLTLPLPTEADPGASAPSKRWRKLAPFFLLTAAYFLLNKAVLGGWTGHYGEGIHLNFDLQLIASNCLKYVAKYLLWWREWPHDAKTRFMQFCEAPPTAWCGLAAGVAVVVFGAVSFGKMRPQLRAAWLGWLLFLLALAPVGNLFVAFVLHGENDRYGYLPSLFFAVSLVGLAWALPRWLRWGLLGAWLVASVFFLRQMTERWQQGARIANGLLADFRWQDAPEVYVLACPDNYQGIPIFKDFSRENLAVSHALRYVAGKPASGRFYQVAQFNLTESGNRFALRTDSLGHRHLEFRQWGNWWWLHGQGLGDYQTEQFRFRTEGNGCRFELKKPAAPGAVFIVAQGDKWEEM